MFKKKKKEAAVPSSKVIKTATGFSVVYGKELTVIVQAADAKNEAEATKKADLAYKEFKQQTAKGK